MHKVVLQCITPRNECPSLRFLKQCAQITLQETIPSAEITLRIVDVAEMTELNQTYRRKNGPTNVLSFPFDMPDEIEMHPPILGDIVICSSVVNQEALSQNKSVKAHWAHMIVHGILHLLGYDHENENDAIKMETKEIQLLQKLKFDNPYAVGNQ